MAQETISIERALLKSEAFRTLNGTEKTVLLDFLMKRTFQKINTKPGRKAEWIITNNGKIEYCYSEAEKKGIPRATFMRAIDTLVSNGFIDIAHSGNGGVKGDKSLYSISDRWRKWGTDDFIEASRQKDGRLGRGFAVFWRNKKSNSGNKKDNPSVINSDNP
ncbi:MAG: hypothetical protein GX654_18210 [Desulfatiglans sp.]|nr:hypothetical protein [Desulfatiglans sp.]